jgi:1-acyl-sn-glycerol-3-phosphate acyltransferase
LLDAFKGVTVGQLDPRVAARTLALLNPRKTYHRASINGAERISRSGAAVIVSNHGRLTFDSFILIRLILRTRRRLAHLMADHLWFRSPLLARVFSSVGAADGTRENASHVLGQGELVLTYPGGVREITGGRFGCEHIDWEGRRGFARVAIEAGVPVIPVVGIGVNSGLVFVSSGRLLGKMLFQGILRLGPRYEEYRNPLAIGIIPVPLPLALAVCLPLPCRLAYFVGEPLDPPLRLRGETAREHEERFAQQVIDSMRELIDKHGRPKTSDGSSTTCV